MHVKSCYKLCIIICMFNGKFLLVQIFAHLAPAELFVDSTIGIESVYRLCSIVTYKLNCVHYSHFVQILWFK